MSGQCIRRQNKRGSALKHGGMCRGNAWEMVLIKGKINWDGGSCTGGRGFMSLYKFLFPRDDLCNISSHIFFLP